MAWGDLDLLAKPALAVPLLLGDRPPSNRHVRINLMVRAFNRRAKLRPSMA